jgi:UDP-2,3-diacylglucosamine pyrophosphatase LpxH
VDVAGGEVSWRKPEAAPVEPASAAIKPCTGNRFRLGVCSDLHFGSKYCMREQLADYAQQAYVSGVRAFVVAGDLLDGCYRHGVWELSHHGWDEQARDALESLPQLDGAAWYFIDGNHDGTFWDQTGAVSGERLQDYFAQRGRDDLIYLGHREGNVKLRLAGVRRPVHVQLWHPKPGKAYALSYQLQKRIEAYAPGTKPDVLIAGHWHTCVYLETRGIHSLAAGCFQSPESAFARSLAGGVSCGGWVLSWECTAAGTMRRVAAERWAYYHREDSRELELAAS